MRHLITALCLTLGLSANTIASPVDVEAINNQIAALLQPIQDEDTEAAFKFKRIDIDNIRANEMSLSARLSKKLMNKHLTFELANLKYDNQKGTAPLLSGALSIGTDLTQLFSPEELNQGISALEDFIWEVVGDQQDYGDGLTINSVVTDIGQDSHQNYTNISLIISAKVDFTKLPEDVSSEDIFFKDWVVSLKLDVKKGLELSGYMNINPDYQSFQSGERGLKEVLEKVIDLDELALEEITDFVSLVDTIAGKLLRGEFPELRKK